MLTGPLRESISSPRPGAAGGCACVPSVSVRPPPAPQAQPRGRAATGAVGLLSVRRGGAGSPRDAPRGGSRDRWGGDEEEEEDVGEEGGEGGMEKGGRRRGGRAALAAPGRQRSPSAGPGAVASPSPRGSRAPPSLRRHRLPRARSRFCAGKRWRVREGRGVREPAPTRCRAPAPEEFVLPPPPAWAAGIGQRGCLGSAFCSSSRG